MGVFFLGYTVGAEITMNFLGYSGPERREFKRFQKFFVVCIQAQEKISFLDEWQIVGLENISEGGMLFNHNKALEKGAILKIKIKIDPDNNPIQCIGRIVRVQKLGQLELYEYGTHFTEIKPEDRALVRQALGA